MSVEIWTNIRDAVRSVASAEVAKEFETECRNRETICDFLNNNFSLEDRDWHNQAMTQVPDLLKKEFGGKEK